MDLMFRTGVKLGVFLFHENSGGASFVRFNGNELKMTWKRGFGARFKILSLYFLAGTDENHEISL
jgi:hypothetical protein